MNKSIWETLKSHRSDSLFQTHVSLFGPKGKFCLDRQKIDSFWKVYCEQKSSGKEFMAGIAEKPQHYLPVLVDVDIARKMEEGEKDAFPLYRDEHVVKLIKAYQGVLRQVLDDTEEQYLYCILLQKDPYIRIKADGSKETKHGFHLHFPYTFLNKLDQETHLVPRVKDEVSRQRIFADIGFHDSASVLDMSYSTVPWLMYGGRKAENAAPYLVTKAYNEECKEMSLEEALHDYKIYDKNEQEVEFKEEIEHYFPQILSIVPYGRDIQDLKAGLPSPLKPRTRARRKRKAQQSDINFLENIKTVKELVAMFSDHRARDHNEWMRVGWALFNVGNGCDEAREIWFDFSRRCPEKYDESECERHWERMVKKDYRINTFHYWAGIDNPREHEKFKKRNVTKYIQQSLNGSHYDIARCMYEMYGTQFVCSSIRHETWYEFKDHHWQEVEKGIFLRKKISTEILQLYANQGKELIDRLANAADAGEKAMYEKRFNLITKLMSSLKNASFKNNIMKEAAEVFYDHCFFKKLDKNPYLICFKNGVYDLRSHHFREGSLEDYISLTMAVNYRKFDPDDVAVGQVKDYLMKVFPDKSVRDYFMDTSSDVFVGGNQQKLVQVWSGEGDNAKSVTQTLFEKMLGGYAVKLPTSLIIGKRTQSSAACPELVRAGGGVRFAVLQEPDQKDVINIGILKELSGNDTFFARTLFKEGGEITPMFKLILICNEPPQLPYGDKAVWNRIRVVPFESTFADENSDDGPPPASFEEQLVQKRFWKDKQFADKIPGMIEAFAFMLLEHRKNIGKRVEPPKVKMATEGYRKKNDIYRQFVEESIVDDPNGRLTLGELYSTFKSWFKEAMPNHSIPVRNDVATYFTTAWGMPGRGMKWNGHRLRTLKDDVQAGDAIVIGEDDSSAHVPL